jgi:hypothetical protein
MNNTLTTLKTLDAQQVEIIRSVLWNCDTTRQAIQAAGEGNRAAKVASICYELGFAPEVCAQVALGIEGYKNLLDGMYDVLRVKATA